MSFRAMTSKGPSYVAIKLGLIESHRRNMHDNMISFLQVWYNWFCRDCYWQGIVWKMEWNGNFGMEYGRCQNGMELKISRMEWKTILHTSYQLHSRFRALYLQKNAFGCRVLSLKYSTSVSTRIICRKIAVLCLCILRKQCTYLHHSKYIAICRIDVIVDNFDRFDLFFFYFENYTAKS